MRFCLLKIGFLLIFSITGIKAQVPFQKGVNLTNWFQSAGPKQIQFTKFTKQDFLNIKSLGCDVIRLPINLHFMTSGSPDYILEPLFLQFLDEAVNWAEELEIHLIMDNHTFNPAANTDPAIESVLIKVWSQMAAHYKDRSDYILYEVLNEPHGIGESVWNKIQQNVIDAIRAQDTRHTIVVGGANWNSYRSLSGLPNYTDNNLLYTFHFYDPFIFTHQGASWVNPSMVPLADVPFPYDASKMPDLPESLKDSWVEYNFNSYPVDGNEAKVKELLDIVVDFQETRNVPVFCGEFGVYIPNSDNSDRVYWYEVVRKYLEEKSIPWTIWDYTGGFGLFEEGSNDLFEYDLNTELTTSLGLIAPPQKDFVIKPDSIPFKIYSDFIESNVFEAGGGGIVDYYSSEDPAFGDFSIHWTDGDQYNHISLDFKPNKDLSKLVNNGYFLLFWVKGDAPGTRFDVRFVDSKTGIGNDLPWRIRSVVNEGIVQWDNYWHLVSIPLSDFSEQGAWDGQWYDPIGAYDWSAVDRFEISLEYGNQYSKNLWFDDIKVTNVLPVTGIDDNMLSSSILVYPNPAKDLIKIRLEDDDYKIENKDVKIYNLMGVELMVGKHLNSENELEIDLSNIAQKCLLMKVYAQNRVFTEKIIRY